MTPLDTVARLEAVEEIKKLEARYYRCLDTKDWDGYRDVFTEDAVIDTSHVGGELCDGRANFMAYAQNLPIRLSVHHGHMPEIEVSSSTAASGVWAFEDHVQFLDGLEVHGYGHYHETYETVDGNWRIKTMILSYMRQDVITEPTAASQ